MPLAKRKVLGRAALWCGCGQLWNGGELQPATGGRWVGAALGAPLPTALKENGVMETAAPSPGEGQGPARGQPGSPVLSSRRQEQGLQSCPSAAMRWASDGFERVKGEEWADLTLLISGARRSIHLQLHHHPIPFVPSSQALCTLSSWVMPAPWTSGSKWDPVCPGSKLQQQVGHSWRGHLHGGFM